MNSIIVPSDNDVTASGILADLTASLEVFTPEVRKAATFVLENPSSIGVSSIREIAQAAHVKPNTLVRLARAVGFDGYESFREPFRAEIRERNDSFPDRARWLQALGQGDELQSLTIDMASSAIRNVEQFYEGCDAASLDAAAADIVAARATFVLGVGVANMAARNFSYLAGMALDNVFDVPRAGSLPVDDLAHARAGDVLMAMTFKPYRREVVDAVGAARKQGLTIIAVTDSPASPIAAAAKHQFIVPTDTPQIFNSMVAVSAFLETLVAFLVANADPVAVARIEQFDERRRDLGIYMNEGEML